MTEAIAGLQALECGADILLYSERSGDLLLLNETAAVVWRSLEQGLSADAICERMAAAGRVERARVEHDLEALMAEWRRIAAAPAATQPIAAGIPEPRHVERAVLPATAHVGLYRLADFVFELRAAESSDYHIAQSVLGHLSVEAAGPSAAVIEIIRHSGRWLLVRDDRVVDRSDTVEGVAPMLHADTLVAAYLHTQCFAALHAGAVLDGEACILLPARSGSGKSTLTAALLAAGFQYCTDDLTLLAGPPIRVRPAPVGMGLKQGSWGPLSSRVPELGRLPIHLRADGQQIRYLPPPSGTVLHSEAGFPVQALVFPQYRRGAAASCRALRPAEALARVAEAGYDARLSIDLLRTLIEWLTDLPSYDLIYEDLDEAIAAVRAVVR